MDRRDDAVDAARPDLDARARGVLVGHHQPGRHARAPAFTAITRRSSWLSSRLELGLENAPAPNRPARLTTQCVFALGLCLSLLPRRRAAPPRGARRQLHRPAASPAQPQRAIAGGRPSQPSPAGVAIAGGVAVGGRPSMPTTEPAIHIFLWGKFDDHRRATCSWPRDGGFKWVKQRFEWRNIEGRAKGNFEWNEPDRIVDAIERQRPEDRRPRRQPAAAGHRRSVDLAGHRARLTIRRTGPTSSPRWRPATAGASTPTRSGTSRTSIASGATDARSGRLHAQLLKASYQAIKAADPQALVITAGMSPTTDSNATAPCPTSTSTGPCTRPGRATSFDVLGVHAAGFKADPCADPAVVAPSPELTNNDPSPPRSNARLRLPPRRGHSRSSWSSTATPTSRWPCSRWAGRPTCGPARRTPGTRSAARSRRRNLVGAFQCARQNWAPWMGFMTVIYIPDPRLDAAAGAVLVEHHQPGRHRAPGLHCAEGTVQPVTTSSMRR